MHARSSRLAFIAFVMLVIAVATLRPSGGGSTPGICILCGERGLSDFLANVLLFAPFGVALGVSRRSVLFTLIAGFLFSLFIEAAQWRIVTGRDASVGDLVSNTTGAVLGWLVFAWKPWRVRVQSRLAAYGSAVLASLILIGALSLFTPNFFRDVYWLHFTPDYESLEQYHGKVLRAKVGNKEWLEQQRLQFPDSVARLLVSEPLEARVIAGPNPETLAPIVSISDQVQEEVILIGIDGTDLVYRFRAHANDFLLDHAYLRARDAFRGVQPGDTIDLVVSFKQRGYCIGLNSDISCGRGFSVGQTWTLLYNPSLPTALAFLVGLGWLVAIFVTPGFLAPSTRLLLGSALITSVILITVPMLIGFAATPIWEVGGALAGLLSGHGLAGLSFFRSK
jgi:hypothetical protein